MYLAVASWAELQKHRTTWSLLFAQESYKYKRKKTGSFCRKGNPFRPSIGRLEAGSAGVVPNTRIWPNDRLRLQAATQGTLLEICM